MPTATGRSHTTSVAVLSPRPSLVLDVGVAVGTSAISLTGSVSRRVRTVASPLVDVVRAHPPAVPGPVHPGRLIGRLSRRGRRQREDLLRGAVLLLDRLVPTLVDEVVRRVDLTSIVRRYVDLDAVVADVDLDAAVTRVNLDAVAERLDVTAVLDRLDLTAIVRDRVDLNGIVALVDLDGAVARVDLEAVIGRVDVAGIAEDVISTLDLPEIIRQSTSAVSSETVREVRMRSITGDDAVGRAVDRLLLRRRPAAPALGTEVNPGTTDP